jgi:hypothetical protein
VACDAGCRAFDVNGLVLDNVFVAGDGIPLDGPDTPPCEPYAARMERRSREAWRDCIELVYDRPMPVNPSPRPPAVLWTRADDPRNHAAYALAAELRALEDGHHAWSQPDGSILVKAESAGARRPAVLGTRYRVRVEGVEDGLVVLSCTCRSGFHRFRMPIPCKHAALAARRLEREGFLRWDHGWRSRDPLPAAGTDLPEQHRRFRRSVLASLRRPLLLAERAA